MTLTSPAVKPGLGAVSMTNVPSHSPVPVTANIEQQDHDATQLTVYDVTPLILDIEHCHTENEFVQPARAVLHKFVPTPLLMKAVRSVHVQMPVGAVGAHDAVAEPLPPGFATISTVGHAVALDEQ